MKKAVATYKEKKKDHKGQINNIKRSSLKSSNLSFPFPAHNDADMACLNSVEHAKNIECLQEALQLAPDDISLIKKLVLAYNSAAAMFRRRICQGY